MGYWGWRPLVACVSISVWVVGCNIVSEAAPRLSPTHYPDVTLTVRRPETITPSAIPQVVPALVTTPALVSPPESSSTPEVYVVQEGDTLLDIAIHHGIDLAALEAANGGLDPRALQVGQQIIIPGSGTPSFSPTPTPLPITLDAPTCYETPAETIVCLGRVDNTLTVPIEGVLVLAQLLQSDGTPILEEKAAIEQGIIPIGSSAPYRATFNADWNTYINGGYGAVTVTLLSAEPAADVEERFVPLIVRDETGQMAGGRYVLTATIYNPGSQTALGVRASLMLQDDSGRVIGYRVMQVADQLAANGSLPLQMEIVPQVTVAAPKYTLYVDARRGE